MIRDTPKPLSLDDCRLSLSIAMQSPACTLSCCSPQLVVPQPHSPLPQVTGFVSPDFLSYCTKNIFSVLLVAREILSPMKCFYFGTMTPLRPMLPYLKERATYLSG